MFDPRIQIELGLGRDLLFHCLAHMDLRPDARNLFRTGYVERMAKARELMGIRKTMLAEQARKLSRQYMHSTHMAIIEGWPSFFPEPERLIRNFVESSPGWCRSAEDISFIRRLGAVLEDEWTVFYRPFVAKVGPLWEETMEGRLSSWTIYRKLLHTVFRLSQLDRLLVVLSPALGCRGRALPGTQIWVAPPEETVSKTDGLLWLVHELIHRVTDPFVLKGVPQKQTRRSTLPGSPGYELHVRLETAVVRAAHILVSRHAPDLLPDQMRIFGPSKPIEGIEELLDPK